MGPIKISLAWGEFATEVAAYTARYEILMNCLHGTYGLRANVALAAIGYRDSHALRFAVSRLPRSRNDSTSRARRPYRTLPRR